MQCDAEAMPSYAPRGTQMLGDVQREYVSAPCAPGKVVSNFPPVLPLIFHCVGRPRDGVLETHTS